MKVRMRVTIGSNILVVEDDPSVSDALTEFLGGHGFSVTTAPDTKAADRLLEQCRYDLILLDVMLPDEDGLSFCRRIAGHHSPILMVSAMGSTIDRIVGLEVGAADYLAKPFEPRELLARIRAVLRRHAKSTDVGGSAMLHFAGLRYDAEGAMLVDANDALVALTASEIRLLNAFVFRPGRLLSRGLLLDLLHGDDAGPFDRAIDLTVSRLRRKLIAARAPDPIETVRGAGYRFVARIDPA